MKNAILTLSVFLFVLSSCNKEKLQIEDLKNPVIVNFESQISRVVGTSWEDDDEVGISATDGNEVTYKSIKILVR